MKKVYCFFFAQKQKERKTENEKHRWKNFNDRRRNQAVTKQKKKAHQSTEAVNQKILKIIEKREMIEEENTEIQEEENDT